MKTERRGMVITGWAMTIIGLGTVLFWTIWEAATTFSSSPLLTILGVLVVLAVMTLLVPVPLIVASRRARSGTRVQAR